MELAHSVEDHDRRAATIRGLIVDKAIQGNPNLPQASGNGKYGEVVKQFQAKNTELEKACKDDAAKFGRHTARISQLQERNMLAAIDFDNIQNKIRPIPCAIGIHGTNSVASNRRNQRNFEMAEELLESRKTRSNAESGFLEELKNDSVLEPGDSAPPTTGPRIQVRMSGVPKASFRKHLSLSLLSNIQYIFSNCYYQQ